MSVLMGVNSDDGRGNITLFGTYEDMEEMLGKDRDTGAVLCSVLLTPSVVVHLTSVASTVRLATTQGSNCFPELNGELVPFTGRSDMYYNYGAVNHYQRPVERWNLGASGHYELTESVEAYFDTTYMNKTAARLQNLRRSTVRSLPTVTTHCCWVEIPTTLMVFAWVI